MNALGFYLIRIEREDLASYAAWKEKRTESEALKNENSRDSVESRLLSYPRGIENYFIIIE
jgi:hypothetical protein